MTMSDVVPNEMTETRTPSMTSSPADPADRLAVGSRVEVRNRLDGRWAKGFEVAATGEDGYRLRRLSDGNELPLSFSDDDVREEKRRTGMWWY